MQRILTVLTLITCLIAPTMADGTDQKPFPVAPHDNVTIEWWYLNAHVTTEKGRHLAMIASFFRFGNGQGQMAIDSSLKAAQSHYLIWAVTDEDTGAHMAYSLGDKKTLSLLTQAATLQLLVDPKNTRAQKLLESLNKGQFPPPTELIRGTAKVTMDPFWAVYGSGDTLTEYPGKNM
ncbi:MAG TPA: lipocalin-like domain-containing protein, partial [Capsulimonadaceae bacterium]|nr:lipocalin-like domain-containing protein [Capsulimonadaceae bacterium]